MSKLDFLATQRPTTFSSTVRMDIRTVATLLTFWRQQGEPLRSITEVVRLSVETFRDVVAKKHPEMEVLETATAVRLLQESGLVDPLAAGRRNRGNLAEQLQLEDSVLEGIEPTQRIVAKNKGRVVSQQQVFAAQQALNVSEENSTESLQEAAQRRLDDLKNACTQLSVLPEGTADE